MASKVWVALIFPSYSPVFEEIAAAGVCYLNWITHIIAAPLPVTKNNVSAVQKSQASRP